MNKNDLQPHSLLIDSEFYMKNLQDFVELQERFYNEDIAELESQLANSTDDRRSSVLKTQLENLRHGQSIEHIVIDFSNGTIKDIEELHKDVVEHLDIGGFPKEKLDLQIVPRKSHVFSEEEMQIISKIDREHTKITHNSKPTRFLSEDLFDKNWTIKEVISANQQISTIVREIQDLSPMEKISYVYSWITERKYEGLNDRHHSTTVVGSMTSGKMICVGYSSVFLATLQLAGIDGIKINEQLHPREHMSAMLLIKDEKYGIDGYYYFDPTWDKTALEEKQHLKHFALTTKQAETVKPKVTFGIYDGYWLKPKSFADYYAKHSKELDNAHPNFESESIPTGKLEKAFKVAQTERLKNAKIRRVMKHVGRQALKLNNLSASFEQREKEMEK